jgi:Family of unknown function (DUF5343)
MATDTPKVEVPPYISYGTFTNFIKGLKETGVPSRIDKSVLNTMSGSGQSALLAALKWLGLTDAVGLPTEKLEALIIADTSEKYSQVWASVMRDRYALITDGSLTLSKATGAQVEQKFRDFGITGSTVVKSVAFFIAGCKDAKIELGPHVKAPKAAATPSGVKRQSLGRSAKPPRSGRYEDEDEDHEGDAPIDEERAGFVRIPIPLHGMADGIVYLPDNLSPEQWAYTLKITKFLLDNYRPDTPQKSDEEKKS